MGDSRPRAYSIRGVCPVRFCRQGGLVEKQVAGTENLRVFLSAQAEGKPTAVSHCWSAPFGPRPHRARIQHASRIPTLPDHRKGCFQLWMGVWMSHHCLTAEIRTVAGVHIHQICDL